MELFELLKHPEHAQGVLETIKECLRFMKKWGRRGIYKEIADSTGFSPAYVGQVMSGKRALTENFVTAVAQYLGVTVEWLAYGGRMDDNQTPGLSWMVPVNVDTRREYSRQAHQALEELLSGIDTEFHLILSILDILKHLPLEHIIDLRWQLLKLLEENASSVGISEELEMRALQMRKTLNCESHSYVKLEKYSSRK